MASDRCAATAWPGDKQVRFGDIKDGSSNTILLVEVGNSNINWLEPRDMAFEEAIRGINVDRHRGICSNHASMVMCVAFADGEYPRAQRRHPPRKTSAGMLTIAGGEHIDEADY